MTRRASSAVAPAGESPALEQAELRIETARTRLAHARRTRDAATVAETERQNRVQAEIDETEELRNEAEQRLLALLDNQEGNRAERRARQKDMRALRRQIQRIDRRIESLREEKAGERTRVGSLRPNATITRGGRVVGTRPWSGSERLDHVSREGIVLANMGGLVASVVLGAVFKTTFDWSGLPVLAAAVLTYPVTALMTGYVMLFGKLQRTTLLPGPAPLRAALRDVHAQEQALHRAEQTAASHRALTQPALAALPADAPTVGNLSTRTAELVEAHRSSLPAETHPVLDEIAQLAARMQSDLDRLPADSHQAVQARRILAGQLPRLFTSHQQVRPEDLNEPLYDQDTPAERLVRALHAVVRGLGDIDSDLRTQSRHEQAVIAREIEVSNPERPF